VAFDPLLPNTLIDWIWLIEWLIDWLIDWLNNRLTYVVLVNPDPVATRPKSVPHFEHGLLGVPLVADEHVTSRGAIYRQRHNVTAHELNWTEVRVHRTAAVRRLLKYTCWELSDLVSLRCLQSINTKQVVMTLTRWTAWRVIKLCNYVGQISPVRCRSSADQLIK